MSLLNECEYLCKKPAKILKTKEEYDIVTEANSSDYAITDCETQKSPSYFGVDRWGNLPHVILIKMFSYLEERQRLNAQFVCRRWYDVIRHSPSLWRAKSFRFSGRDPRDLTQFPYRYATHFLRNFGKYVQYLEFKLYSPVSSGVCRKFQKSVKICLNHLIKCRTKLKELSMPLLQLDRAQWMVYREDMCSTLARFFCKGQHTLEEVYLRGARAPFDEGYKILYALGYNTGSSIIILDIEDFFGNRQPVFNTAQFVECMKYYTKLQEIDLNYSYLSEDLLEVLAKSLEFNSLKKMYVKVFAHDPHNQVIWGHLWTNLSTQCPNLKVNMLFQRVMTYEEHFRILCPQIPLSQITFDGCFFADQDWQIAPTLGNILPHFKANLREVCIDLPDTQEVFETELLNLTQCCPQLTRIKLNAFISSRFVGKLLQLKEEKKCNLTVLKVRIFVRDYDTREEERGLERIYNKYKHVITHDMEKYQASCSVCI